MDWFSFLFSRKYQLISFFFTSFQRRNKNVLNSLDTTTKDENGNVLVEKDDEYVYKIEPAWFNICGFIYLHYATFSTATVVSFNKTLVFGEMTINLVLIREFTRSLI